jgi:VWFA-related protein
MSQNPAVLAGCLALLAAAPPALSQDRQVPRVQERVEVSRVLLDVRVVDDRGMPVQGLNPSDFRVTFGGKPARVESAYWLGAAPPAAVNEPEAAGGQPPLPAVAPPEARGRLIVLLFQKDLDSSRIVGLMRMLIETREFLDSLGPDDRVAVLSFDSHLRIWLDFTKDIDKVRQVLERGILFERPTRVEPVESPALMTTLDVVRARRAYSIEDALALLGQALEPLPGAKSVVFVGHGFGRIMGMSIYPEPSYGEARRALQAARASVFCLDVTDADYHTLEAGLQMTAGDTGGFFERTHVFTTRAIERLAGALAGHYVLFLDLDAASKGGEIEVEVKGRTVLVKRSLGPP